MPRAGTAFVGSAAIGSTCTSSIGLTERACRSRKHGGRWPSSLSKGWCERSGCRNTTSQTSCIDHAQRTVDVVQIGLSLIDYLDARDDIVRYGEAGIAVTVFDVLGSGILTGKTMEEVLATWTGSWLESGFFKRLLVPGKAERSFAVAEGLRPIAARLGATVAQVPIAWVLHQPGVTAALAGSRSPRHTQENAQSAHVALRDSLAEIERLIPLGPTFAA